MDHVTKSAAHLSLVEIGLGALVHGFKLPFGGHLLSLNQGLFLCRAGREAPTRAVSARWAYEISGVAATLKSLSPAGQKLGPMLSISMQGLLFALGQLVAGTGLVGQSLSMVLLALWGFAQPLITLWISFGSRNIQELFAFYQTRQAEEIAWIGIAFWQLLALIILGKLVLAAAAPLLLNRLSPAQMRALENKLIESARAHVGGAMQRATGPSPFLGALKDLTRPLFLISFVLMILFWSVRSATWSEVVWLSLRPLGIAFLIFYLLRSAPFMNFVIRATGAVKPLRPLQERALRAREYLLSLRSAP